MPLSEHEERILAEIERRLVEDDPRFVQRARKTTPVDVRRRRLRLALAGFILGALCVAGLTFAAWVAYIGFALMFASVVVGARTLGAGGDGESGSVVDRFRRLLGGRQDQDAA